MAAIDLGRLRFYHQGAYNGATTYEMNDVVTYGDKSFVYTSTTNAAGNLPTNATYWSLMAGGQDYKGAWVTATAYKVDDIVVRGGSTYICLIANTSGTFATDLAAAKWESFVRGIRDRGSWAANTAYLKDDAVYNGVDYSIAQSDFTSGYPGFVDETGGLWATVVNGTDSLPPQASNTNAVLTTNGTAGTWANTLNISSVTLSNDLTLSNSDVSVIVGANALAFANTLTNPTIIVQSNAVDYSQIAFRNLGTNANSSTDIIAYADEGTDAAGWIDMGITSNNFADASFTITSGHDGYIFMEAPANTTGKGNLILATGGNGTQNKIIFAAGGLSSDKTQMVITPNTSVAINIATNSTSATTGALTVAGGLGVGGNVYINGNTNIQGTITVGGGAFESNNLTVSDPIVFMGNTNTGDTFDLGFAGKFDDGAVKYAGLLRDASDGKFKLFTDLTTAPTSTANFAASSNASLVVANFEASGNAAVTGNVTVTTDLTVTGNTTASTNLTVTGNATVTTDLAVTGNTTLSTDLAVTGNTTLTGGLTVSGALIAAEMAEIVTSGTISTNVLTLDWTATNISYVSSPAANFTLNVTNAPTTDDRALAVTVIVTQGATPYIASALQIGGVAQTIKWAGGSAPSGTASKIDIFSFVLLRTGSAWTVFGSSSLNY
jgi:cytoskeletal protein CcmA (bactofilin family)